MLIAASTSCLAGVPSFVHAQRVRATVDVEDVQLRYDDTTQMNAIGVSPSIEFAWPMATLDVSGNASRLGHAWSTDGIMNGSLFTPRRGVFVGEFTGSVGGSAHQDGTKTGTMLALGRMHMMWTFTGAWIGAGGGRTWDGSVWRSVRRGESGLWVVRMPLSAVLSVEPTVVDDSIRYTDVAFSSRWRQDRMEFGVSAGWRAGAHLPALTSNTKEWGSASAVLWVLPRVAIVGAVGTYPVDYTQGFPGGRFISFSCRFRLGNDSHQRLRSVVRSTSQMDVDVKQFLITTEQDHQRVIRVLAPSAHDVEIAGDFTAWQPVQLVHDVTGWWSVTIPISPGSYQVNLRIDHTRWEVPPGLIRVTDEFGSATGVLVVQ